MMQQMSPDRLQALLEGGAGGGGAGVGGMLNTQEDYYSNLMQGNIPDAIRQQMMGAGADAATSAGNQMNRTLAMTGGGLGGAQGSALQNILDSQSRNTATQQMGQMIPDLMKQGQQGMQNVLGARQGMQASLAGLERSNMADRSQFNQGITGGLLGAGLNFLGKEGKGGKGTLVGGDILSAIKAKGGASGLLGTLGQGAMAAAPWALGAGALWHNRKGIGNFLNKLNPWGK